MIVTHMRRTTAVVFMKVFFSVQHVHAFMLALAHEVHNFPTVFLHRECFGSAEKLKLLTKHVPNNSSVNLVHPFLSLSRLLLQEPTTTTTLLHAPVCSVPPLPLSSASVLISLLLRWSRQV